jgi:hypothetical protein
MDIFYNYIYLDPRKPGKYEYNDICFLYEPIYVGKGKNKRKNNHITYYKTNRKSRINSILYNKLDKIFKLNLNPFIIEINQNTNESIVYDLESILIKEIGTIDGETIKRGTLCNFCIDNRPPNHAGKTYEEIYGVEKAKIQRKLRNKLQKDAGGYFKGKKHTTETLKLLSKLQSGKGNARYGVEVTQEIRNKIGKANKGKKSKRALNYIFTSSLNGVYNVKGNDIIDFCKKYNISKSTLDKRINTSIAPKYGKTQGWKLYHYDMYVNTQEEEIISYTVGAFKQDVDDENYDEFNF